MLMGSWKLSDVDGVEVGQEINRIMTFLDDGTWYLDRGGNKKYKSEFEFKEASNNIHIIDFGVVSMEFAIKELAQDRLVINDGYEKMGYQRLDEVHIPRLPTPEELEAENREHSETTVEPTICSLNFSSDDCLAVVTLNGIEILRTDPDNQTVLMMPTNTLLIGKDNLLRIEVSQRGPKARLAASIEVTQAGEVLETPTEGDLNLPVEDSGPIVLEQRFDSPVAPFRAILDGRKLSAGEVLDFAITLRDWLRNNQNEQIAETFEARVEMGMEAFGVSRSQMEEQLLHFFEWMFTTDLSYQREDLVAVEHCNGKLWEIRRKNDRALLFLDDGDGGYSEGQVWVADLGGGMSIVR